MPASLFTVDLRRRLNALGGGRPDSAPKGRASRRGNPRHRRRWSTPAPDRRSEEHTSELQSLMRISYAVFCFFLPLTTHPCPPRRSSALPSRARLLAQRLGLVALGVVVGKSLVVIFDHAGIPFYGGSSEAFKRSRRGSPR